MGFEGFKTRILDSRHRRGNAELTLPETFLAGAGSAMGSAILTQPFDVLKTRRQVSVGPVSTASSASSILSVSNAGSNIASSSTSTSTLSTLVRIVRTEGAKALFAGVGPRTLKVAPACGMMIGCYEGVGRLFKETNTTEE
jgi:solute carrier family 25 protein 39/40